MTVTAATAATGTQDMIRFVALDLQHAAIQAELRKAFDRLLGSSAYTLGEELERFEAEFAAYCGTRHCVGVASGTAALSLMLRAHDIGRGDEVIVPAHTFIASALAVAHAGATPVLCDVLEDSGLIDPEAARAAIGPRTAAILAVHLYGQACDMTALTEVARTHGVPVLEDAAQAHGARHRGRRTGALGAAAAFSFYPSKNLGALGDGGAICLSDDVLSARLRRLRNLGQRSKGEHVEIGFNERLDGLQAALLRVKLRHLDRWNDARRAHAARYDELLDGLVGRLEPEPEDECVYHLYPVRLAARDLLAAELGSRAVSTAVHYTPAVHGHPAWPEGSLKHGELPVAERWAAEELSLPMHPDLGGEEVERVAAAVEAALLATSGEISC